MAPHFWKDGEHHLGNIFIQNKTIVLVIFARRFPVTDTTEPFIIYLLLPVALSSAVPNIYCFFLSFIVFL